MQTIKQYILLQNTISCVVIELQRVICEKIVYRKNLIYFQSKIRYLNAGS